MIFLTKIIFLGEGGREGEGGWSWMELVNFFTMNPNLK